MEDINKEYDEKILNGGLNTNFYENESRTENLHPTMTDEDVKEVAKAIDEAASDPNMEAAKEEAEKDREGYEEDATIRINTETGEKQIVSTGEESPYITETFEEFMANHADDTIDMTIDDESVKKTIQTVVGEIEEGPMLTFLEALHSYQEGRSTAFDTYSQLPEKIKNYINAQIDSMNISMVDRRKYVTPLIKNLLDSIIEDAAFDKCIIDMNTELDAIYTEFGNETNKFYQESIDEKLNSMKEVLAELDPEKDAEKIEFINKILHGLEQSISFEEFIEMAPKLKIKHYDMEAPDKLVKAFNTKYNRSKYNILDLKLIFNVLNARVGIERLDCVIFGVAFCKYCTYFKPTNIEQHVFMYYTISNIVSLAASMNNEYSEVGQQVIDNIKKIINIVKPKLLAKGIIKEDE